MINNIHKPKRCPLLYTFTRMQKRCSLTQSRMVTLTEDNGHTLLIMSAVTGMGCTEPATFSHLLPIVAH